MHLTADVIAGFSSSLLQKSFDSPVKSPECHYEWWQYFCSDSQLVAIAAPRGHAKTTALTHTYTLASVLFRERSYVLVVSDTITQAVQFLGDIKRELMENESVKSLFKIKEFIKETEDDFICICDDGHMFRISAKGSEQKVRGLKWNNKRPDLIVCDDLENDEIVLNKERRQKFKRWFYGALLPCRSYNGIVRYVGTILHNDSLLESVMPKRSDKYTIIESLKTYSTKKRPSWLSVKYRAHTNDFKEILWEDRYDREFFVTKRQEYLDQGLPDVYSQEYLNIPIDESLSYFRRNDFLDFTELDHQLMQKPDWKKHFNFYIGSDLAVSQSETADFSVFIIGGVDENNLLYIFRVIRERMDSQEIVETMLSLQRVYNPIAVSMEKGQIEKAIGPFLRQRMLETGDFINLLAVAPAVDKLTRARSIQARIRAGAVKFDQKQDWFLDFEEEAIVFPRAKHDDQVDALAYLGLILDKLMEAPTSKELDDERYHEEMEESGLNEQGRNEFTGY
jgi:predicted phage terminase large subunit-like protein